MKRFFFSAFWLVVLATAMHAASDSEVLARKTALDVAGAFSNDGYKIRDGNWSGIIKPKEILLIQLNLYAGNEYWFTVGTTAEARKLAVTIYDETGQRMEAEPFQDAGKAAAGFAPAASGCYYVKIQELEGEPANFCFIYSYK